MGRERCLTSYADHEHFDEICPEKWANLEALIDFTVG